MAAGLGFKDFTTGEVLTAADVDGYLMQGIWVFANATARDAAVTSPQEGNACYLKDTDVIQVYTGSTWAAQSASNPISANIVDAKGDLIVGTAADTVSRLAVGTNGYTLVADSAEATGLKWAAPASGSTFVGCQASNTATTISIANNTLTKIAFNTEVFDTDGFHDNATNNTRFTVPAGKAGYYLVSGSTSFAANSTGERIAYIYKNNSDVKWAWSVPNAGAECGISISAVVNLAVADYVEFAVKQNSGSALNTQWAYGQYGWFELSYLGA